MRRRGRGLGEVMQGVVEATRADAAEHRSDRPLKVLIADDHPLMLAGVRRVLERSENIEIVGEAHTGPEVLGLVERRRPELVLLDLRMPGVTGTDCLERIKESWPEVKTVVLSACEDRESIDAALNAGASAYVVKSVNSADIASVIRQAASGSVFHPISHPRTTTVTDDEPPSPLLTDRERVILEAVAAGLTTAAISKDLWVSEHTIKFHLTNIYRKLGVANRAGAVRYALEHDLAAV
jgi:DNA-binding NarL/FixJ family response regulator